MRRGSRDTTPTVVEVVRRAIDACRSEGDAEALAELLLRFEDRDEPVTALLEGGRRELFEQQGRVEGQDAEPSLEMAAAVATYLAFRRDSLPADDDELLRLAARAEYDGRPPPHVAAWLALRGIEP